MPTQNSKLKTQHCLTPDWPAPPTVRAATTTRVGGVSRPPFDTMNLADHVGDDPEAVAANRAALRARIALPTEPVWLNQVHGTRVCDAAMIESGCEGDAGVTDRPGVVCAVLTADCLPVLLCDRDGTRVAAVHAGWRGLAAGVVEAAVDSMDVPAKEIMAWLGPAIGPHAFEVGGEVRAAFVEHDAAGDGAFRPSPAGRWLADLYELACLRLAQHGVNAVYGGGLCTFTDATRFYSYRRDGTTGRMATLIWLVPGS